jgi:hypothetical protein
MVFCNKQEKQSPSSYFWTFISNSTSVIIFLQESMTTEAISILPLLIFYTLIGRGVLGATLFDKVCLRLAADRY